MNLIENAQKAASQLNDVIAATLCICAYRNERRIKNDFKNISAKHIRRFKKIF
jgi:NTP pyrophosphatase (non-canonical NTP hydrolase)